MTKKLSIGVPCFNEEENIENMYHALKAQMQKLPDYDYEIIFADNDSEDRSQEIMKQIAEKDKKVKVILNQTNFGPERSGVNCYRNASGDAYIGIPCDFQEPPELIPEFVHMWEQGFDIVWGQKNQSKEGFFKYQLRKLFYWIINVMSDYPQLEQVTGYGLMDKKVIDILLVTQMQDPEFNVRNLVCEYGFKIKLVPYTQRAREHGKSSYTIGSYFHFAITSLCNTSVKPLHMMTVLGIVSGAISMFVAMFYLIFKLLFWNSFNVGMAPLVIGLFLVSSIQLFCIGMLGEYIAVLVRRVTHKPLVIEKEKYNFESEDKDHEG